VRSVTGNTITIELDEDIRSTLPIIDGVLYRVWQIGSFVRIPMGYTNLYGVITQAGSDAIPEKLLESEGMKGSRWIKVSLIGEAIGKKFEKWILQFPIADDKVHLVTKDDLELIYGGKDEEKTISVWQVSASEVLWARIDIDRFVNRHSAILGSTGSGKSNTVSVILSGIASRKDQDGQDIKSTRILLVDPHGEYSEILKEYSQIFKVWADLTKGEKELQVPYWALPFNEFIRSFPWNLSEKQEEYIREKVLQEKIESSKYLVPQPKEEAITADSPIPFSVNKLWFELDDFERQTFKNDRITTTLNHADLGDANLLKSNKYTVAW